MSRSALWWAACLSMVVLAVLLLRGHGWHVLNTAPYLVLLACPLLHLFGHGRHGGHGDHGRGEAGGGRASE